MKMDMKWWNVLGLALSILTYGVYGVSLTFCLILTITVGLCTAYWSKPNNSSSIVTERVCPGKPIEVQTCPDSITISWDPPTKFSDNDCYEVFYKNEKEDKRWTKCSEDFKTETATLTNLKSTTTFIFRVRVLHDDGEEGQYSPVSDVMETTASLATVLIHGSTKIGDSESSPVKHALPLTEIKEARNVQAKTKKFVVRNKNATAIETKTIMLIGATGSGKTTFVDGIMNYIVGVTWEDQFRFSIVDLDDEEKDRVKDQASSQTKWITCYTVYPESGSRLKYKLQIIDTPGFGDTGGLERDQEIIQQVRHLFSKKEPEGVSSIDAVCFLVKAPDQRLTPVQKYIFHQMMSLFGKNIKDNICTLITFADGNDPPVLDALKKSQLPFGKYFTFNNSALFARNTNLDTESLSPLFWSMGLSSFQAFFRHIGEFKTKSLQLTKDVLQERFKLEVICGNLQETIDIGLDRLSILKQHKQMLQKNRAMIEENKDFVYEVDEQKHIKTPIPGGIHNTKCDNCYIKCHPDCIYKDDEDKRKCTVMDANGNCTVCPDKCKWNAHRNDAYKHEYVMVKKKMMYSEMKAIHEKATGELSSYEGMVNANERKLKEVSINIEDMMFLFKECNAKLEQIALKPDPLSVTEHIDILIENEKMEKKEGFLKRIEVLNKFRKNAELPQRFEHFSHEANVTLGPIVGTGKAKDVKSVFKRVKLWFKDNIQGFTF